jgi:hypothetical protein
VAWYSRAWRSVLTGPPSHRTLRLIMTTGAAGASMCLVLAIVMQITALHPAASRPAASAASGTTDGRPLGEPGHNGVPQSASRHSVPGATIASYQGTGSGNHGSGPADRGARSARRHPFEVGRPGAWGISWRYSCPRGVRGRFTVSDEHQGRTGDVEVSASGPSGRGTSWDVDDPGRHTLDIRSSCPWVIHVVLPGLGSGQRPLRQPSATASPATRGVSRRSAGCGGFASARRNPASAGRAARHPTACRHPRRAESA